MQFEYDPEKLIYEVKKRPGLWDSSCEDHRNKDLRQRLWVEIVKEVTSNTSDLTKSEMRELELQLQKKWKSIRDCFQKYMNRPNRTKRPYIYARKLQFLVRNDKSYAQDSDDDSDNEKFKKRSVFRRSLKIVRDKDSDDDEMGVECQLDESSNEKDEDNETAAPSYKIAKTKPNPGYESFAFASVDSPVKPDETDPDKLFLLSLLPHLKSIPEAFRLNVKMELMQVLQNANYSGREIKLI